MSVQLDSRLLDVVWDLNTTQKYITFVLILGVVDFKVNFHDETNLNLPSPSSA